MSTTVTFDTSILVNYYAAKAGVAAVTAGGSSASAATPASAPTAPWQQKSEPQTISALTASVIDGGRFINPSAAKLDAPATAASASDYRNLFALYQGLSALNGIAVQASANGVGATQAAALQQRFAAGMKEVQDFLAAKPFASVAFADANVNATATSVVGAAREVDGYTTGALVSGDPTQAVPGLDPDAKFSLTARKLGGDVTVDFDLADLGNQPRTLANVTTYLNARLSDAGLLTRFGVTTTAGVPRTTTANGQTLTLGGSTPTTYGLSIKGNSIESLSFSAAATTPAVYLAQTSGLATGTKPDATQQLFKLNAGDASGASDRVFGQTLPAGLGTVRATAAAPDGSVYLLADVTGATPDGQQIQGAQDVALVKYDSAGTLAYVRTLGAAQSASGYALAVSPDGGQVAVAGTVTGDLDPGDAPSAGATSSFVQVYDAAGDALWDQRSPATGEQPQSVAFGANGALLVSGVTHADQQTPGVRDTYLRSYTATAQTAADGSSLGYRVATASAAVQGSAASDKAGGLLALPNGDIATAALENGHAVLRLYSGPLTAGAQPVATRDLGDLGGGSLAGLALGADGSIIVAGASGSGGVEAGSVTTGYQGGVQAFVAKVSADLQASAGERTTYLAASGNATATGVTVANGQVYLAGQVAGPPASSGSTAPSHSAYALAVDPDTGQVGWSESLQGADGQAAPSGLAVNATGASALDALGLPTGEIDYAPSTLVTANTSARAGDSFYVRTGSGAAAKVTLAADDTLASLSAKITRAAGSTATVTTTVANGRTQLKIAPASSNRSLVLQAGPDGSDLLTALGMPEGVVQAASTAKNTRNAVPAKPYALGLPSSMSVATATEAQNAATRIQSALVTVKKAYTDLITPPASKTSAAGTSVSAYTQSRIADYQLALQRLTGAA